jgi:hypothetical protein
MGLSNPSANGVKASASVVGSGPGTGDGVGVGILEAVSDVSACALSVASAPTVGMGVAPGCSNCGTAVGVDRGGWIATGRLADSDAHAMSHEVSTSNVIRMVVVCLGIGSSQVISKDGSMDVVPLG